MFLDLAKSFDTVSHNILLKLLDKYRIRGAAHHILNDLQNEHKCVKINQTLSEVKIGVPQRTKLGLRTV